MESEKVKEIKDNITICTTKIGCNGCSLLPIMASTNCRNKLLADTLSLINELEEANERLREESYWREQDFRKAEKRIAELERENEILQGTKNRLTFADRIELVNNAVEVKLKQFAERLKERLKDNVNGDNVDDYVECAIYIDETLKDFINQDKNYTEVR